MAKVVALLTLGFRRAYQRAVEWLRSIAWNALHLNLPAEFESFVRAYVGRTITEEELWRNYVYLTGSQTPFVRVLRSQLNPVLDCLKQFATITLEPTIYCYQDLSSHIESRRLSEKVLMLEFRERVGRNVQAEEWRKLLSEELRYANDAWQGSVGNIVEKARRHSRNIMLYGGHLKPLRQSLEVEGFSVEIICPQTYWRSPIDSLRTIFWMKGAGNVTDEEIEYYVERQIEYLDLVLSCDNIDEAHESWAHRIQQFYSTTRRFGCVQS